MDHLNWICTEFSLYSFVKIHLDIIWEFCDYASDLLYPSGNGSTLSF